MLLTGGGARRPVQGFLSKYAALLDVCLRIADVAVVLLAAVMAARWRFSEWQLPVGYANTVLPVALLTALIFPVYGLYSSWRGTSVRHEVLRLALALITVAAVTLIINWALRNTAQTSRLWAGGWFLSTLACLVLTRVLVRATLGWVRSRGIDQREVVLVGATDVGAKILSATRMRPHMGLVVRGYVGTTYDSVTYDGVPCLGDLDSYLDSIRTHAPDQLWVALPLRAEESIRKVLSATRSTAAYIRLVPDFFGYELINQHAGSVAGIPIITLRGSRIEGHARIAKAMEDRIIASLLLLLLSPLMLIIAVAVKCTSRGPILFRQKRHGLGGREFIVRKFRSMYLHEEVRGEVAQARRDDERVTPLGRILRRTSLDELPQLFNVLGGTMSLVGPRPHAVEHNRQFADKLDGYMQRHGMKPGLTGLAQVSGLRGETDTIEKLAARVEADIFYIRNWSVWLDLKIISLTPIALLRQTNAY